MQDTQPSSQRESIFSNEVLARFELYNSLFLTLPFYKIKDTGTLLPLFIKSCEEAVKQHQSPAGLIADFFAKFTSNNTEKDIIDLLFRFIQYIERQVVLFDAIEDASFGKLNITDEQTSLRSLFLKANDSKTLHRQVEKLVQDFSLRLVLTAHPTQFYPGSVLAIINDLTVAIKANDISNIHQLLQQLGKTPFFNKKSPTPVDEALNLAWYLENVFYFSAAKIQSHMSQLLAEYHIEPKKLIELGFWPGGDRDGNPNVSAQTTAEVAKMLRQILFRCYYRDFRNIKRRITFRGVEDLMASLQDVLYKNAFDSHAEEKDIAAFLTDKLEQIANILNQNHDGLFVELINDMLQKVRLFRSHFASLDIRQDSRILRDVHAYCRRQKPISSLYGVDYDSFSEEDKLKAISFKHAKIVFAEEQDDMVKDTLQTIAQISEIQKYNGQQACHRFIISNCQQASDILQLMELFLWSGWKAEELTVDFVPLFETVGDLAVAQDIMETLYTHPFYAEHLKRRGGMQHIMLGFSDSTKDGGYLTANWSIFKAKVNLTRVAEQNNIRLAFFDGRGGPPSRGGGKTHRFYAAMGKEIANKNIQVTIQGQTISSQYGSIDSAAFNMEQLINAGISSGVKERHNVLLDSENFQTLEQMSKDSYEAFIALRNDEQFLPYLEKLSPLKLLSKITISSRPVKRGKGGALKLEDLRAISFVTSWSQLKQNVPGFYGIGTALQNQERAGNWAAVQKTYDESGYLKTIVDNCMMSMSKSDFEITAYLAKDEVFGRFWQRLHNEYQLSKTMLLKLSGQSSLMENYPVEKKSIAVREKIIQPLVLMQHFALEKLQGDLSEELRQAYEKLAIRTVYGVVNAGRNLA